MVKDENKEEKRGSFITNNMGEFLRELLPDIARPVALWGTAIFLILFGLTFVCHGQFVCNLFSIVSGFTLLSLVYALSMIYVLDLILLYRVCHSQPKYKLTVIWGIFLILMGLAFLITTNRYKKNYKFDCTEWYVDISAGLYHCSDECKILEDADDYYVAKGYEIRGKGLSFCDWCREDLEDKEASYEPIRHP